MYWSYDESDTFKLVMSFHNEGDAVLYAKSHPEHIVFYAELVSVEP